MKKLLLLSAAFLLPLLFSPQVSAGGLSADTARNAMCEDVLAQCMDKVKADIPCADADSADCREKRRLREKQCAFLHSHCMGDEPPVKRIKPVLPGEEGKKR